MKQSFFLRSGLLTLAALTLSSAAHASVSVIPSNVNLPASMLVTDALGNPLAGNGFSYAVGTFAHDSHDFANMSSLELLSAFMQNGSDQTGVTAVPGAIAAFAGPIVEDAATSIDSSDAFSGRPVYAIIGDASTLATSTKFILFRAAVNWPAEIQGVGAAASFTLMDATLLRGSLTTVQNAGPPAIAAEFNGDTGVTFVFSPPEIVVEHPASTDLVDGAASIDFGSETIGVAGAAKTFTIRNTGTSDLTGLLVTVNGIDAGDFSIDASGMAATLAPGASTTFDVTFTPASLGARSADLHIASNDADENPFDIALTGAGTGNAPTDIFLSPDAVVENASSGTPVGLLTAADTDVGDSFTYSFVSGSGNADNGKFTIDVDALKTAVVFDHEVQATATVRLKAVDSFGLEVEKELLVTITDDRGEDFDMDGLTEAEEEDVHGTSDTDKDSDDDGFEDGFEVVHGFDPDSDLDGTDDRDGDGWADWLEVRLGTDADVAGPGLDPAIHESPSGVPMVRVGPGGTLLGFSIERSITVGPPWTEVVDFPVGLPLGQSIEWVDENVPAYPVFYRVRAWPLPLPVTAPDGFTWVSVGDPGNLADPATGHGSVAAEFQISAHEVTIGQWVEFLNAKQASEPAAGIDWLWLPSMVSDQNVAGIARNGVDGSYTYQAIGSPERAVTFVSWLDAARYVNWLHNGKGSGDTEGGVYDMSRSPELIAREPGATYFLPTRDEWYKAAYYDPTKGGGSNYWLYPTQSDALPGNDLSTAANFANFRSGDYTLTPGDNTYSGTTQYLSKVGSFTGSASHYGTFDQGGSVWEWTETLNGTNREGRGGTWGSGGIHLQATSSRNDDPATENAGLGFRVAKPAGP